MDLTRSLLTRVGGPAYAQVNCQARSKLFASHSENSRHRTIGTFQ